MKRHLVAFLFAITAGVLCTDCADAQRSRRITRTRCRIPNCGYSNTRPGPSTVVESRSAVRFDATPLGHEIQRRKKVYSRTTAGTTTTTEIWEESAASAPETAAAARKEFVIPTAVAGRISMTSPAATLYDTGEFHFSCRLNYVSDEGSVVNLASRAKFDPIASGRCVVRIEGLGNPARATSGSAVGTTRLAKPVLFDVTRSVRVEATDHGTTFRILARDMKHIGRHFDEISQLRVYVQSRLDR